MNKVSLLQYPLGRAFMFSVLVLAVFLTTSHLSAGNAQAAQANLSWAAPTTYTDGTAITSMGGYNVYVGTTSGNYTQKLTVGNVTSYTVGSLADATTYYFAVSAYDTSGDTSALSKEVSFTTASATSSLYTITASAGAGGSITPAGSIVVSQGSNQSFTITPSAGYQVASVTVDGASVGAVTSYSFSSVKANHTIAASFTSSSTSSGTSSGTSTFADNSGGAQYTDSTGVTYAADSKFTGGSVASTTATISGTSDPTLYKSERYGNFSYSVPVTNGSYAVTLKFAEIYFTAAGQRVFNVAINGQTVISNLDIYAKVGKNVAYDVVVPVNVTNGALNITFTSVVNNAKVSAIKVAPTTSTGSTGTSSGSTSSTTGTVVFADNGGGSQYTGSGGVVYAADSKYTGGSTASTTATISGTTEGTLYQSERYGNFSYGIPVANGNYAVTLKFAEIYFAAAGKRTFNIVINGQTVISNLDIYAKVGKNVAYDVTIPVSVTNGALNIQFVSVINNAKISGIKVVQQ